jgi:hypothetical protein
VWRRLRVREDRGGPRFARWEPLPRRVGAKQGRTEGKAIGHRAGEKDAPTAAPGAAKRHSPPPVGQNSAISDSEGRSDA